LVIWDSPLLRFRWGVDVDGYFIEDQEIFAKGGAFREYLPLHETPTLHRILSDTPATNEGALEFVTRYGLFGLTPDFDDRHFRQELHEFFRIQDEVRRFVSALDGVSNESLSKAMERFNESDYSCDIMMELTQTINGPEYYFMPTTLAAAIAFLWSEEVTKGRRYNKCIVCGKWFPVGPSPRNMSAEGGIRLRRSDSETCSNACKVQRRRNRTKLLKEKQV
jgi:hypothetical protein